MTNTELQYKKQYEEQRRQKEQQKREEEARRKEKEAEEARALEARITSNGSLL